MVNKMDEAFNVGATYEEDDDDEKDGSQGQEKLELKLDWMELMKVLLT